MNTLKSDLDQLGSQFPELATSLRSVDGLSTLLPWCVEQGVDAAHIDIVAHDEYTHDAILAWRDRWLVFGVTGPGALTAVAVWSHRPTAEELLQARVLRGWRPTASMLRTGTALLGSACSFARPRI